MSRRRRWCVSSRNIAKVATTVNGGGSAPGWSLGQQGYAFLADGRVAAHYSCRDSGTSKLIVFEEDVTGGADDAPAKLAASSATIFGAEDGLLSAVRRDKLGRGGEDQSDEAGARNLLCVETESAARL